MAGAEIESRLVLLREAITLTGEEQEHFLNEKPEVYAVQYFPAILSAVTSTPDEKPIRTLLRRLASYVEACEHGKESFVIGYGPFELLWSKVNSGNLRQPDAERTATAYAGAAEAEVYLRALTSLSRRLKPQAAWQLLGITRSGATARRGGILGSDAGVALELRYVQAISHYLVDEADGRLAKIALAAGEAVLAKARAISDHEMERGALVTLGALCSNPYTARTTSRNLEAELHQWQRRFADTHREELIDLAPEDWQMPPAAGSLVKSASYYSDAARLMTGNDRGRALKGAFQSLAIAQTFGESVDKAEISRIGHEAARLIDPDEAPSDLIAVLVNLDVMGETVDKAIVGRLLAPSLDARLRQFGDEVALEIALNTVPLLRHIDPARAEAAAARARPLVELLDRSYARARQWQNEIEAAVSGCVPGGYDALPDSGTEQAAATIRNRAGEEWDPQALAVALVGLAGRSPHRDEELLGLRLIDEAEQVAPVWSLDHQKALRFLRSGLRLGAGVNAVNAEDWPLAIEHYAAALGGFCDLDLPESALDLLTRVDDLIGRSGYEGAVNAVVGIAGVAVLMENLWGEAATEYMQRICRHALAALAVGQPDQGANPEALLVVLQVAKGMRYAALLLSNSRFRWREDHQGEQLLADIARAESGLPQQAVIRELEQSVDDQMLLAAFTSTTSAGQDGKMAELHALRQAYDRHLYTRLLTGSNPEDLIFLGSEAMTTAIDARTVLIDIYIGISTAGTVAIYTVALTSEGIQGAMVDTSFPDSQIQLSDKTRSVLGSIMTLVVSDLRRKLLEPSEPDDVSSDTRAELADFLKDYLPGVAGWLDGWRNQGKTHLCFVPHGPLHYLPFHLLQHDGEPLAARWTVTALPNHALMLDVRGGATTTTRRDRELAAFGLTYPPGNAHGLRPLPNAAAEATAVAAVFGDTPVLDPDATEERFRAALTSARYVHLAAHGRHDYEAPAFQCIYLTPEAGSDGCLRAYELLSLDLRGTDMVTLSACESSLGRVDLADNPRGLPAALLLAGVRSVVGTLWDVRSDTAEFFFTALYTEVRSGRPTDLAFTYAQRQTRTRYPVYRDWGAFCYIGLGRHEGGH